MASSSVSFATVVMGSKMAFLVAVVAALQLASGGGAEARGFRHYKGISLMKGQNLTTGQYLGLGKHNLVMQADCNLVLYGPNRKALGASNTNGAGEDCHASMLEDGNFVVYGCDGTVLWSTGTNGVNEYQGEYVTMQRYVDRNVNVVGYRWVVMNCEDSPIWESSSGAFDIKYYYY